MHTLPQATQLVPPERLSFLIGLSPARKSQYSVSIFKGTVTRASGFAFSGPNRVPSGTSEETVVDAATTAPFPMDNMQPGLAIITQLAPINASRCTHIFPIPLV